MRGSLNTSDLIEPPVGQMSKHSSIQFFLTAFQGDEISRTVIDYYPVAFYEFWEPAYIPITPGALHSIQTAFSLLNSRNSDWVRVWH